MKFNAKALCLTKITVLLQNEVIKQDPLNFFVSIDRRFGTVPRYLYFETRLASRNRINVKHVTVIAYVTASKIRNPVLII